MNYNQIIMMVMGVMVPITVMGVLRDPTKPPEIEAPKQTVETQVLRLDAVIIGDKERRYAIINGVLVQQGHWYADAQLEQVDSNYVILQGPKGPITVTLWQHTILHEPGSDVLEAVFPDVKIPRQPNHG